ncbi:tetratricopeptide repeat protein [Nocardiopsis potens]|uniref:tetratricopeptide repeat protein n=1 Tax=Nocardiopsis potens TaxID=1246458 RepID=UPI00034BA6E1|nr:tetratricopeptide repeat protein [Nocardiopsis potens]
MTDDSAADGGHQGHRALFAAFAERFREGDHRAALAAADDAHDRVLAAGLPDLCGVALNCAGLARYGLGEFTAAAESHRRAGELSRRSDVRGFAALRAALAGIAAGESVAYPQVWETGSAPARLAALARSEHPHLAPAAGVELGRLLRGEREYLAAVRAYRAVVDSGHPRFLPRAAAALAELLREAGDSEGADRLLGLAGSGAGAPDQVESALAPLDEPEGPPFWLAPVRSGIDRYRAGDPDAARAELRAVAAGGWRHAAHQAGLALAGIELRHGRPAAARRILEGIAETADFTHGPRAAIALAALDAAEAAPPAAAADPVGRYLTRDPDAASALEAPALSGHPSAGLFAVLLGDLPGDGRPGAAEAREQALAVRAEDETAAGCAAYLAAVDPAAWDDTRRVEAALAEADRPGAPVAPWAALLLGELDLVEHYGGESQYRFRSVLDTGPRALMPRAAAGLFESSPADRYSSEERYEAAAELLGGDPPAEAVPPLAWLVAERLIRIEDDLNGGREALERIPESDPRFGAPALAVRLAMDGDADGLRPVFERLARWDEESLKLASECCMPVLWKLPADSAAARRSLLVLADLGDQTPPLVHKVSERLIEACVAQGDLEGEVAAREAENLRLGGHPGGGLLKTARRLYLAGDLDRAIGLYRRVTPGEFPEAYGKAATDLGVLLRHLGRSEEAPEPPAGGPDPGHCSELGGDLERAGRIDEAVLAWELVSGTGDAAWTVRADHRLGEAYAGRGETGAAVAAYLRAAAAPDSFHSGLAWHELGLLYQEQGDLVSAERAQLRGAEIGDRLGRNGESLVGVCRRRLVELAELSGDPDEARRRCLYMVDHGDRGTAAMGAMMLGHAAKESRDTAEARRWYQWVIDSGDLFQRELALAHLGELYYLVGDREQAREFYRRTLGSTRSSPDLVAEAACRLGEMAAQDGDTDQAVSHLERARDTGDAAFAPQAERLLNELTG